MNIREIREEDLAKIKTIANHKNISAIAPKVLGGIRVGTHDVLLVGDSLRADPKGAPQEPYSEQHECHRSIGIPLTLAQNPKAVQQEQQAQGHQDQAPECRSPCAFAAPSRAPPIESAHQQKYA